MKHFAAAPRLLRILTLLTAALMVQAPALGQAEEPDFFFLTGGPYTQGRHSPQLIWSNQLQFLGDGSHSAREYSGAGRFEFGITDRWEADFEFGAVHSRERLFGAEVSNAGDLADFLFGVRYRLLDESSAPLTLTLGPQLIAPAASRRRGLGLGKVGYGFDLAAAKDWGGPVFAAASLNISWTPNVSVDLDGSGGDLDLTETAWAAALGWRPLERATASGTRHDLHVFFELAAERVEELESGGAAVQAWLFSPGLRYGFVSQSGLLVEIGTALPIGLDRDAPDWGWILQFQLEWPSPE